MLNLLYSWKESLKILIPKNLKLFLLVTLRLALNTYKTLLLYFWWIPVVLFLLLRTRTEINGFIIFFVATFLWIFFTVISARPSLGRKDWHYFIDKAAYIFICFISLIIFGLLLGFFDALVIKFLQALTALYIKLQYASSLFFADTKRALLELKIMPLLIGIQRYSYSVSIGMFVMPLLFFNWFFILDTSSRQWLDITFFLKAFFRSFIHSFKLYIYNLPLLLVIGLIVAAFGLGILLKPYLIIMGLLLMPFYICLLSNIYTKRVHEQMDLYYK